MENDHETTPEVTPPPPQETVQSGETAPKDTPPQVEEVSEETTLASDKKPTPPWLRKTLLWASVILGSLLIGFGLAYFLLFVPAQRAYFDATQNILLQEQQIEELQANLNETRQQLQESQNELSQTSSELKTVQYTAVLAALQNNISYARLALVTKDLLTARQELSSANSNLKKFIPMIGDKDIETALTERLALVRTNMVSDPEKSLEELRILAENLSRLERP